MVKVNGNPKIYVDNSSDSGNAVRRAFCSNCGSPVYSAPSSMPGIWIVKLGLFDEIPQPSMEVYCRSRPSWQHPVDGAIQFYMMPDK